jgi:hypothetical protein
MSRHVLLAITVCLTVCAAALCEEIVVPKGVSLGLSMGQRSGDVCTGIDVTTPYFFFHNQGAIRLGTDMRLMKGVLVGGTTEVMEPYYGTRIGYVRGIPVSNHIRMYGELGGMALFPTDDIASSTKPHFSAYGHFGGEVFLGAKSNMFNKNGSIYMDIGDEVNGSGKARFDKLVGSPMMGTGPTACAGVRYYL